MPFAWLAKLSTKNDMVVRAPGLIFYGRQQTSHAGKNGSFFSDYLHFSPKKEG